MDQVTLKYLAKGALNGENNGLTVIVDAETFDYGNGFGDYGERAYSEITNGPNTNSTIWSQLFEYLIIQIIRCNSDLGIF